jgi:PAS domain S-box-containing protein
MPASVRRSSLELALEASELRYRRLFETAQDGILILNANTGKIIDVNPFLLDLLEYPFESMIGLRLWEIGQFKDIAANQAAFEALQSNEYIRYENLPLRTKTGKEIQVEFVSNVYFVGSGKVIQCNIRDISARAELQAASKIHADTLELACRARDEAIAVLSHDLRTPMGAISSMIDVLELGHGEPGTPDKKDLPPLFDKSALAFIRRNIQTLVHLVTELLDFTHVANGALALKLEKVDAHEVIRFVLRNLESQQKGAGIGIDLRLQAQHSHIRGDSGKLEQVLSNLIGNAVKFTPAERPTLIDPSNRSIDTAQTSCSVSNRNVLSLILAAKQSRTWLAYLSRLLVSPGSGFVDEPSSSLASSSIGTGPPAVQPGWKMAVAGLGPEAEAPIPAWPGDPFTVK